MVDQLEILVHPAPDEAADPQHDLAVDLVLREPQLVGLAVSVRGRRAGVVAERGVSVANRVWEGPEMLPTMEELRNPPAWIERVEGASRLTQPLGL